MKFYSEVTKKVYDTEKDLIKAENEIAAKNKEAELLKAKRAERAKEVENAYKKVEETKQVADELLTKFVEDYGSYHTSIKSPTKSLITSDLFDSLFTPIVTDIFDVLLGDNNKNK